MLREAQPRRSAHPTRRSPGLLLPLLGAVVAACASSPAEPPQRSGPAADPAPDLASRFFRHETLRHPLLSPNGRNLAALRSEGDTDRIVWIPLDSGGPGTPVTLVTERRGPLGHEASRAIRSLQWANDERILFAIETPLLSEEDSWKRIGPRGYTTNEIVQPGKTLKARKTRLYITDLEGNKRWIGKRWRNASHAVYQHRILSRLPDAPDHVLVHYQNDVIRLRLSNGATKSVHRGPIGGYAVWHADHRGEVRLRSVYRDHTTRQRLEHREGSQRSWRTLAEFDEFLAPAFELAGTGPDPDRIQVFSPLAHAGQAAGDGVGNRDTTALLEYDVRRRRVERVLASDPDYDVDSGRLLRSPVDGRLLAVSYYSREGLEIRIFDEDWKAVWERLQAAFPDHDIDVEGFDASGRHVLVRVTSAESPPSLHWFDGERVTELSPLYPQLRDVEFSVARAVRYPAPGRTEIEAFLTHPPDCQEPGPTLVLAHDGPAERVGPSWDPVVQYLVQRGFHVFQPNFRGSSGYGRRFERAGDREWGGAIQDDIRAGTEWLIAEGVADPERIGIFGQGFGGYSALLGLAKSPELYRAGASLGGIADLVDHLSYEDEFVRAESVNRHRIGHAFADRRAIREASPIELADRIRAPVLLGHGSENPTVHVRQARAMERALERAAVPVDLHVYPGATDRFLDDRQRVDFFRRLGDFFETHLVSPRS